MHEGFAACVFKVYRRPFHSLTFMERLRVMQARDSLTGRERSVLDSLYGLDLPAESASVKRRRVRTQREVAALFVVTPPRIWQMEQKAFRRIRGWIAKQPEQTVGEHAP